MIGVSDEELKVDYNYRARLACYMEDPLKTDEEISTECYGQKIKASGRDVDIIKVMWLEAGYYEARYENILFDLLWPTGNVITGYVNRNGQ